MESGALIQAVVQAGIGGVVLYWFMQQNNARLDRTAESLDRLTRALLIDVLSRADVSAQAKLQARQVLSECPPARSNDQFIGTQAGMGAQG